MFAKLFLEMRLFENLYQEMRLTTKLRSALVKRLFADVPARDAVVLFPTLVRAHNDRHKGPIRQRKAPVRVA